MSVAGDTYAAAGSYKYSEENSDNTYGYDYFGKMSNGAKLQAMYRELDSIAKDFHNNEAKDADSENVFAVINFESYGLTSDEALSVWQIYKLDHPLYYWISVGAEKTDDSLKLKVVPEYRYGAKRVRENKTIESKLQGYLDLVKGVTDPYDIAWILQREICLNAEYERDEYGNPSDEEYCHNIIGILKGKGTVCEGYSKLFSLLLNECGIDNVIVLGDAGEPHSWNMVKLKNGKWYYCDLTWDDYSIMLYDTGSFNRFMKGSNTFSDHEAYTENGAGINFLYKLPNVPKGDYSSNLMLGKTFKVGKNRYSISGYKEVTLYKTTQTGDVTIPETVKYKGVTYKVVAFGKDNYENTLVAGKVRSVTIPKTVRMIWDNALQDSNLKSISVDSKNQYYRSKNGILYTKSYYTLVQYPSGKKMSKLVLPKNTHLIAWKAILTKNTGAIGELVVNANFEAAGVTNWGMGPIDKDTNLINFVDGGWGQIASSCKKITISKANKEYCVKNNCIVSKKKGKWYLGDNSWKYATGLAVFAPASCNVKSITLPKGTVKIKGFAFYRLPKLKTVKLNKELKAIDSWAFYDVPKVTKLVLPEGLIYLDGDAVSGSFCNPEVTYDIYIPKSVKKIDSSLGSGHIVIHGVKNSYAQKFAKKYGHEFTTKKLKN